MAEALVGREPLWYGELPTICVKTGEPADRTIVARFEWVPPWTFLLLFAGVVPFFIALVFVRETTKGRLPVTDELIDRHHAFKRQLWLGWGLIAAGPVLALVTPIPDLWLLSGFGALWVAVTELRRNRSWVTGVPLSGSDFVELRRVHPDFAAAVASQHHATTGSV